MKPGEVIVADNGSTDGSQQIARNAGAHVVDVPVRGYGAAITAGCAAALGEYLVIADADASYDLGELEQHYGLRPGEVVAEFSSRLRLVERRRFELGLNNLLVFVRT